MNGAYKVDNFIVNEVFLDKEINFEILDSDGYICRLVPGYAGFELSKLDQCLGINVNPAVIHTISNLILTKDN